MKNSNVNDEDVDSTKNTKKGSRANIDDRRKNVAGSSLARFIREQWMSNPELELIRKVSDYFYTATLPYSQLARTSEAVDAYLSVIAKENASQVIHASLDELDSLNAEGDFLTTETPTHCIMMTSNPKQKKSIDDLFKMARNYDQRVKTPSLYVMLEIISHLANDARATLGDLGMQWILLGRTVFGKYPAILIPENKESPIVFCFVKEIGQGVTSTTSGLVVFTTTK